MSELYLMHHGVKGMRWGVRKYKATKGKTVGQKLSNMAKSQTKVAKKEANRHSAVGTVASAIGKAAVHTMLTGAVALPLGMLAGPAAPLVYGGAAAVQTMFQVNDFIEGGVRLANRK